MFVWSSLSWIRLINLRWSIPLCNWPPVYFVWIQLLCFCWISNSFTCLVKPKPVKQDVSRTGTLSSNAWVFSDQSVKSDLTTIGLERNFADACCSKSDFNISLDWLRLIDRESIPYLLAYLLATAKHTPGQKPRKYSGARTIRRVSPFVNWLTSVIIDS